MKRKFIKIQNIRMVPVFGSPTCGSETLPETDFDFCDPVVENSEIQRIFLRKTGSTDFSDWTQAAEWNERVSETSMDDDAIRPLTVIGDKPAPSATIKNISNGRKVVTRKDHTINATIDDVSDANHALIQEIETGKRFLMNYETAGGRMFGGNSSIPVEIMADMVLARGQGEIAVYNLTITWASNTTEQRCASPIFGETVLGSASLDTTVRFVDDSTPVVGASDFILAGGTNAVAKFQYNEINPAIGTAITMTVKVGGVLKLTMNSVQEFLNMPFIFTDTAGVEHAGLIADGDVLF